jgi:16S rRNA processing protein RimM
MDYRPVSRDELALLGRLGKPFGVEGEIRLWPLADEAEWYYDIDPQRVYLLREARPPERRRVEFRRQHGGAFLVSIDGHSSPEEVKKLAGLQLAIPIEDRPALGDDDFYADELIGLTVIDSEGAEVGVVDSIVEGQDQALLSIKGAEKILISPSKGLIAKIDLENRKIQLTVLIPGNQ